MQTIEFDAYYGDELKHVRIWVPFGIGDEIWHVNVGGYYEGSIKKKNGEWIVSHLPTKSDLTSADILIIGELIDEKRPG